MNTANSINVERKIKITENVYDKNWIFTYLIITVTKMGKRNEKIKTKMIGELNFKFPNKHLIPNLKELIISFFIKTKGKIYMETTPITTDRSSFTVDISEPNKLNRVVGVFKIRLTKNTFNQ